MTTTRNRGEDRGPSPRISPEEGRFERAAAALTDLLEPGEEMPGTIYIVPDHLWGFTAPDREDHPGACAHCDTIRNRVTMVKGSGRAIPTKVFLWVDPSGENGLKKSTAFEITPRYFRLRRIALLHFDRRIGKLTPKELADIRGELERLFPEPVS